MGNRIDWVKVQWTINLVSTRCEWLELLLNVKGPGATTRTVFLCCVHSCVGWWWLSLSLSLCFSLAILWQCKFPSVPGQNGGRFVYSRCYLAIGGLSAQDWRFDGSHDGRNVDQPVVEGHAGQFVYLKNREIRFTICGMWLVCRCSESLAR